MHFHLAPMNDSNTPLSNIPNTRFGPPRWEDVAMRLMPRLRSGAYVDRLALEALKLEQPNLRCHMQLTDGVHITLVIDDDDSMTHVTTRMLNAWGRSFHEACARAIVNLATSSKERVLSVSDGVWVAPWQDAYAASRVLLGPRALLGRDELVVTMPDRDTMLIADPNIALALEAMVLGIEETSDDGLPITRRIFNWRTASDGLSITPAELSPYQLPSGHAASVIHRNLVTAERLERYAEQHWPLQAVVSDDDLYVASAESDEAPDGLLVSRALWTQGVDTLLPEVDRVHMLETDDSGMSSRMWVAPFEHLAELPNLISRHRCHLARWRTERFPTQDEIRLIANPIERDTTTAALDSSDQWERPLDTPDQ
jgi:hypothetical protein